MTNASVYGVMTFGAMIVAQAAADSGGLTGGISLPSLIAALSGGGFSIWYGWYMTAKVVPKMQMDNNAALTKMNADNNTLVTRIVQDFRDEMKLERQYHDGQITRLVSQIERLADHHATQGNASGG